MNEEPRSLPDAPQRAAAGGVGLWIWGTIATLVLIIVVAAVILAEQRQGMRTEIDRQLALAGDLKTQAVESWLQGRLHDAEMLTEVLALYLGEAVHRERGTEIADAVRSVLEATHRPSTLGSALVEADGSIIGVEPSSEHWLPEAGFGELIGRLGAGASHAIEVTRSAAGAPVVLLAVPGPGPGVFLVLGLDPHWRLYPLLVGWPSDHQTTETFVAAPRGDALLLLAPTRHDPDAALERRISASDTDRPAVQALHGARGLISGIDYRERAVRAFVSQVEGTDWILVSKIDVTEVEAPLAKQRDTFLVLLGLLCLLVVAASVAWRMRTKASHYAQQLARREQLRALDDATRLHAEIFASTDEAMLVFDRNERIIAVNPAYCRVTGEVAEGLIGGSALSALAGVSPDQHRQIRHALDSLGVWRGELEYRREDGSVFPAYLRASSVLGSEGEPRYYVCLLSDLTEQRETAAVIDRLAHYDASTGLPNAVLAQARLEHSMEHARRDGQALAVLRLQLEDVERLSTQYSAERVERLIGIVVERWRGLLKESDLLARIGPAEFLFVCEHLDDKNEAGSMAHALISLSAEPVEWEGGDLELAATVGAAVYPGDAADATELMRAAAAALRRAREEESGRFALFSPALNAEAHRLMDLESGLRRALARGELQLHYQPKVELATGRVTGVEALMRWQRADGSFVPPVLFIPVMERLGLIVDVGRWALETACAQLVQWHRQLHTPVSVAVNVSARQFLQADFDVQVAEILRAHDVPRGLLELELTESMLVGDIEHTARMLERLKGLGVRLSLDDFGTGYSSLGYLTRLPLDALKIDRSFVMDIAGNARSAAVGTAVIDLGQRMGMTVIAEGVETEAQLAFLRRHGCEQIQGYLFSRPLPASEASELLGSGRRLAFEEASPDEPTLLVVDDDDAVIAALKRELRRMPYRVLFATSGAEALEVLARHPVHVVLSDHRMQGMTGTELLARVRQMYPAVVRMMLSGYADVAAVTEAINDGAVYRYLSKPWDDGAIAAALEDAFKTYHRQARRTADSRA